MTCREAIRAVFERESGVLTTADVVARLDAQHPARPWKRSTIATTLIALSVNHTSSKHYPGRRHAFLLSLGGGKYRHWDVDKHGELPADVEPPQRGRNRARKAGSPKPAVARSNQKHGASARPARSDLLRRLVDELRDEPYQPYFRRQPHGEAVRGWPARLRSYFWPHPTMDGRATAETLGPWFEEAGALSRRLLDGSGWQSEERRRAAVLSWQMLTWGGVTRQAAFSEETVEAVFRRSLGLMDGEAAPMNSGWTKVAALATAFLEGDPMRTPHVIWDSRVSTSIVWRIDRMFDHMDGVDPKQVFPGLGVVLGRGGTRPKRLQRAWAHPYGRWWGQEAGTAVVREIRDMLNEDEHGRMPLPAGGTGPWTIRGVESVLFMDGY